MYYIGVDPGKDGAMSVLTDDQSALPDITYFEESSIVSALEPLKCQPCFCILEHVGAMPKQGSVSMFNFGVNFGFWQGVLTAFHIPYELMRPAKWKKEFSITADKNTSILVCKRAFPGINLFRTPQCKKEHDGAAEASLMALLARRKAGGAAK